MRLSLMNLMISLRKIRVILMTGNILVHENIKFVISIGILKVLFLNNEQVQLKKFNLNL